MTGRYFNRSDEARASSQAYESGARSRLRTLSEELTGVPFGAAR